MPDEENPPPQPANPAALLARKRWDKASPEERTAAARNAAQKRWEGNPEGMREHMRAMGRQSKGKPRSTKGQVRIVERCPCGRYSVTLAAKRGHKCEQLSAPETVTEA